jgi:hypothetical protein
MFCFERIKSTELALNPIGCPCQFKSHGSCLQAWFEEKNQYQCPICHTVSVPYPVQQSVVQVVRLEEPRRSRYAEIPERQQRCIAFCCLTLLLWALGLTILEYLYGG